MRTFGMVYYTPDGYYSGCYSFGADAECPCYASEGCYMSSCSTDSDCDNADEICGPYSVCQTVQPYVSVEGAYYTPGNYLTPSTYGNVPYELPIQVWNGTSQGYPYYYIFMYGKWIGWYPNTIFDWPYGDGVGDAGGAGPMVSGPATYLQVGGEVFQQWPYYSTTNKSYHGQTSMASDWYPTAGYKKASYHRNIQYMDSSSRVSDVDGSYVASNLQTAALTFYTYDTTPSIPLYNVDTNSTWPDGVPGLCGYAAGQFTTESNDLMWYATSESTAAGGTGWGEYFYVGTVGLH